jgi:hypothetical protein
MSTKKVIAIVFLGPEKCVSGEIHVQRPNHQFCVILCNPEMAMTCDPKLLARPAVNRGGSSAIMCMCTAPSTCVLLPGFAGDSPPHPSYSHSAQGEL